MNAWTDEAFRRLKKGESAMLDRRWFHAVGIGRKYALAMIGVVATGTLVLGASECWFAYHDALRQLGRTQVAQANQAAAVMTATLQGVRRQAAAAAALPWEDPAWLTLEDRRAEYRRLLHLSPFVDAVLYRDANGVDGLRVSRADAVQHMTSALESAEASMFFNRPEPDIVYKDGYEPMLFVDLALPEAIGSTVLVIGLRALAQELGPTLEAPQSTVLVVDENGVVVLSRQPDLMLARRKVSFSNSPLAIGGVSSAEATQGINGRPVIASSVPVPGFPWRVVVEEERSLALQPLRDTLVRAAIVTVFSLGAAGMAAMYLARKFSRPILRLNETAARLARGDLAARSDVSSDDELGSLASQFNAMAGSLQETISHQEQRIAEKTLALETANRHKSEFLSNMSHELRTPLNSIIAMSEVLEDQVYGPMTTKQLQYAHFIHTSGNDLLAQINDILDMSKIEAGTMVLEPAMVDVTSVAHEALASVREMADKKGIVLDFDAAQQPIEWPADRRRVKQIMLNLLSNAVKFTGPGGRVSIDLTTTDAHLRLRVVDTGCGIAEKDLPHLFQPFRQFDGRDDLRAEGAGLGLALVRRLAGLHGGTVTAWSELGVGSRFTVELPRLLLASSTLEADGSGAQRHGEGVSEVPS